MTQASLSIFILAHVTNATKTTSGCDVNDDYNKILEKHIIHQEPLLSSWIKFHTDDVVKGNDNIAYGVGLLQNELGVWLGCFFFSFRFDLITKLRESSSRSYIGIWDIRKSLVDVTMQLWWIS